MNRLSSLPSLVLALLLSAACGGSSHTADPPVGGDSGPDARRADAGLDASTTPCPGPMPLCADDCGSDWFPEQAVCTASGWVCPPGTVNPDDCPSGTCWGPPLPGEVCDGGWACQPTPEALDGCPELLCATCRGFEPVDVPGCACACEGGEVHCAEVDLPPCEGLEPCECFDRVDCRALTDTCICDCDYECPGHLPCDCDCGGGTYLGCAPVDPTTGA